MVLQRRSRRYLAAAFHGYHRPAEIKDVFIKPNLSGASFELTVANTTSQEQKSFSVLTGITDKKGGVLYKGEALQQSVIHAGEERKWVYAVKDLKTTAVVTANAQPL